MESQRPDSANGSIEDRALVPPSADPVSPTRAYQRFPAQVHVWTPPLALRDALPRGFSVSMTAWIGADGLRRFTPTADVDVFVLRAALSGAVLLESRGKMTAEERFSYDVMRYVYQLRRSFREDLRRTFKGLNDLSLPDGFSGPSGGGHVLPAGVGQDTRGAGVSWSPARLVDEGRRTLEGSTVSECGSIHQSLLVAAQRNPVPVDDPSEARYAALVRMALFNDAPIDGPLAIEKLQIVERRLLETLDKHVRADTSFLKFDKWMFGNLTNIVLGISKRKDGGGKLTRPEVRSGLLDLTFRSFRYVGDCVHVFTRAFAAALPEPLGDRETQWFDALFARRPWWGGLPLILLRDRLDFLGPACADVYEKPDDPAAIGVVLRLLDWYGQMARNRRKADTGRKQRGRTKVVAIAQIEPAVVSPAAGNQQFIRIATAAIRMAGAGCECYGTPDWDVRFVGPADEPPDPVPLHFHCQTCGVSGDVAVPQRHFKTAKLTQDAEDGPEGL